MEKVQAKEITARIDRINCYRTVIEDCLDENMKISWFTFDRLYEICSDPVKYETITRKLREIICTAIIDSQELAEFIDGENGK